MGKIITVTQINSYIKDLFKQDYFLNRVSVKGEISNCKYHSSGHLYFTLKDSGATLSCIMFAASVKRLDFLLADGMQVVVDGRIEIYERDGKYQLYASDITKEGIGDLYKKYEELKNHFQEMGYFEKEYKRSIPVYAKRIGIVTASTGAAIADICNISYRRNPYVKLILYPAYVQGEYAVESIVEGIRTLDELDLDVMIVGRGGGSIEDLWAFNCEEVVEAIFNARTPIISAVGHETDFTIADFVADLRAPTPSAAAELAVADINAIINRIDSYAAYLTDRMNMQLNYKRTLLDNLRRSIEYLSPLSRLNDNRIRLDNLRDRLDTSFLLKLNESKNKLSMLSYRLSDLSPVNRLTQGYSYATRLDGSNISSVKAVSEGDEFWLRLKDGSVRAAVMEVKSDE